MEVLWRFWSQVLTLPPSIKQSVTPTRYCSFKKKNCHCSIPIASDTPFLRKWMCALVTNIVFFGRHHGLLFLRVVGYFNNYFDPTQVWRWRLHSLWEQSASILWVKPHGSQGWRDFILAHFISIHLCPRSSFSLPRTLTGWPQEGPHRWSISTQC